jgi:ABC-type multidrug transport system, ATPase component
MRKQDGKTTDNNLSARSRLWSIVRRYRKPVYIVLSVVLWIALWQYKAGKLGKNVLLPYPKEVLQALRELVATETFRPILRNSLLHIVMGFVAALAIGCVLAVVCRFSEFAAALLMPPMKLVKTVPVVSFIILLLLWVDPAKISIVISFLIVLPVVYANVSRGIRETSPELLEMAKVFRIPFLRRLRYLYIPNTVPYATAAVSSGLSLCWKAGIAAEIIGLSKESIGRQLYDAKLYLDTASLFAWTVVIIIVSVCMEWFVMIFLRAGAVALADPTLWHRPSQAFRFIVGLPLRPETSSAEEDADGDVPADDGKIAAGEDAAEIASEKIAASVQVKTEKAGDTDAENPSANKAEGEPLLVLHNVSKAYNGRTVLEDVSLTLRRGEVLLITGPSGGGKTTILRCMLGLVRPDRGTVEYPAGRPRMSAVFQEDRLCEGLPAWKNVAIALPGRHRMSKADILAELTALGIDDGVYKPVRAFSGGMKRRTAWLRALAVDADLIVLDEPFTGLDAARKDVLIRRLHEASKDKAIAIVTHNASEIENICTTFSNVKSLSQGAGKTRIE